MQQYKDRDPKWIKLDRELLDNYEFTQLPDESKFHVIGLRLLAAKMGNKIPNNPEWIGSRIAATSPVDIQLLLRAGFIEEFDGKEICVRDCTKLYTEKRREEESKEEKRKKPPSEEKDKYRDFVYLTSKEYEKLCERWMVSDVGNMIDKLNEYIGSTGKKYKSHYHTILMWSRKDSIGKPRPKVDPLVGKHKQWHAQCGLWLGSATKEEMTAHGGFRQRLKELTFREWAESINPIVKEI